MISEIHFCQSPCTEGKDGIIAKVATWRDIRSREAFQFLNELPFGAVVFALGADPLPPRINDGDLDGDLYQCIWDSNLIEGMQNDEENINLGETVHDDLINTEFQHVYAGKQYTSLVVKKLGGDLYHVATGPLQRVLVELTKQEITEGRDFIEEIVDFRGSSKLGQSVEFKCKWSTGGSEWFSLQQLCEVYGDSPPIKLKEYVLKNKLHKNGVLPNKYSMWITKSCGDSSVVQIVGHRRKKGAIEVLGQYDDGDKIWEDLKLHKKESKIIVGAYAKKKNLFAQPGWEGVQNFWLEEVQHLMCKGNRSMALSNLTPSLFSFWKKSFNDLGPNHDDTVIWGRAYKESNDIEKHGVVPKLPLHLYRQLSKNNRKYVGVAEYDVEHDEEQE